MIAARFDEAITRPTVAARPSPLGRPARRSAFIPARGLALLVTFLPLLASHVKAVTRVLCESSGRFVARWRSYLVAVLGR